MQPISSEFARSGDILMAKFVDKRVVYVISSAHVAETIAKIRMTKERVQVDYQKPSMIDT